MELWIWAVKGTACLGFWRNGIWQLSKSFVVDVLVPDNGCVVYNLQGSQPQGHRSRPASRRSRSRSFRRRPPPQRPIYYSEVINQLERVNFMPRCCSQNILLKFEISWLFPRNHGHARQRLWCTCTYFTYCSGFVTALNWSKLTPWNWPFVYSLFP